MSTSTWDPRDFCDPRWAYTRTYDDSLIRAQLKNLAKPGTLLGVDRVDFQPCVSWKERSQDRHVIRNVEGWKIRAVFDGHAGHEVADHLVETLCPLIEDNLKSKPTTEDIPGILKHAIASVDQDITNGILELFPTVQHVVYLKEPERTKIIDANTNKLLLGMRGSTVLVSVVDPKSENLWVASLGDSQAGWKEASGEVKCRVLSSNHNGTEPDEVERIRSEHPNEPECIMRDRVLGAIAVTRAVGDHLWKLPRPYTENVFLYTQPGFSFNTPTDAIIPLVKTPPYISADADVQHFSLSSSGGEKILILCSDGLTGLYPENEEGVIDIQNLGERWTGILFSENKAETNRAMILLRDALGGNDYDAVCRKVFGKIELKWLDDVTVLVEDL